MHHDLGPLPLRGGPHPSGDFVCARLDWDDAMRCASVVPISIASASAFPLLGCGLARPRERVALGVDALKGVRTDSIRGRATASVRQFEVAERGRGERESNAHNPGKAAKAPSLQDDSKAKAKEEEGRAILARRSVLADNAESKK